MLNTLNSRFSLGQSLTFEKGEGGFIKAILRDSTGHLLDVYLYGANISRWSTLDGEDILFMSSKANFNQGKAIRGGIPVVFPQFSSGKLPSHGFARVNFWTVRETSHAPDGGVRLVLVLESSDQIYSIWPYRFKLEYIVTLTSELSTKLVVENCDSKTFSFQNAFHTYFAIGDVGSVQVDGLRGLKFLNNLKKGEEGKETRDKISISEEVDRVYVAAPEKLEIKDPAKGRSIGIHKQNLADAVLWNPWSARSREIGDLGQEDYKKMLCLETGNVARNINLQAGEIFECEQVLSYKSNGQKL